MPSTKAASEKPPCSLSASYSTPSAAEEHDVPPKNVSGDLALKNQESSPNLSEEAHKVAYNEDDEKPRSKLDLEDKEEIPHGDDDFPDGGLEAWLIVFGVTSVPSFHYQFH
jgi:hypothetical protein